MLLRFLLFLPVAFLSCREIEPFSPPTVFSGYQLEGNVTTANGFPLQGVEIRLFYLNGNRYPARDTTRLLVTDSIAVIQAIVMDSVNSIVRRFSVLPQTGYLPRRLWDEKDSTGAEVKNGLYTIRVYFNGYLVLQYRWLVDERLTAVTNANGQFLIPKRCLPVGEIVDRYNSLGEYDGTFDITEDIVLHVATSSAQRTVFLTLRKDQITRILITL